MALNLSPEFAGTRVAQLYATSNEAALFVGDPMPAFMSSRALHINFIKGIGLHHSLASLEIEFLRKHEATKPVIVTNYASFKAKSAGLDVYPCECRKTVWAFPWDRAAIDWLHYAQSPIHHILDDKGLAPKPPTPKHHVIIADRGGEAEGWLKSAKWSALPTSKGCRARYFLHRRTRKGTPLHRLLLPDAKVVRFKNGNGLDLRRANMVVTTKGEINRENGIRRRKALKTGETHCRA